jgi:hypothetical protein
MPIVTQRAAPATRPVLRTGQRRPQAGPAPTVGFEWYFCPQAGAFSHLVLVAGQQPLGHWVLPAVGSGAPVPTTGLWLQVAAGLGLARPVAHAAGCRGTGAALRPATPPLAAASGGLVLHLPAANGLRQLYWLRPLQPGSLSWLLSCGRPHDLHY